MSLVYGQDIENHLPLIYMPPAQLHADLRYSFGQNGNTSNSYLTIQAKRVFKQNRIEAEQDFLDTPASYTLVGLEAGTGTSIGHSRLKFSIQVDNLLNIKYRDYLNRLRYFSDEPGVNISFRVNYSF